MSGAAFKFSDTSHGKIEMLKPLLVMAMLYLPGSKHFSKDPQCILKWEVDLCLFFDLKVYLAKVLHTVELQTVDLAATAKI